MANQAKPDVNTIWGGAGFATPLSKAKQALGFVAEIPEYDQFNGMIQQISQFQQHVNQEGVALWDALTTYGVGSIVKSPIDRSIYRCLNADQLNVPPVLVVGGAVNANWVKLAHTDAEIQALIGLYGVTATNLQQQTVTAFTTAGAAPTFTLTPNPPIAGYAAPLRFRVKFNVAGLAAGNTLNVSGKGPIALKQYNAAGAKIEAVITANLSSDVEYDGADFVLLDALPAVFNIVGRQGAAKKLRGNATGLDTALSYTYDEITLKDSANTYVSLPAGAIAPALNNANGANGLDAGVPTSNTWYFPWVIYNPTTQTKAGLLSLSDTAPVMPAGYTFKARVGSGRTDGTAAKNFLTMNQEGNIARWGRKPGTNLTSARSVTSGTTSLAYVANSVSNFCPSTAYKINLGLFAQNANSLLVAVAPNANYSVPTTGTPVNFDASIAPLVNASPTNAAAMSLITGDIILESTNVYYISNYANANLIAFGWEDAL